MRSRHRIVRAILSATVLIGAALVASAPPASAGEAQGVVGYIETAFQAPNGSVAVSGWIYRKSAPDRHMLLCVWSNDRCVRQVYTRVHRPVLNERHNLSGDHGFRVVLPGSAVGPTVTIRDWPARSPIVDARDVSTPGSRIVAEARKYVGRSPYLYGGASPAGFDCSGFTLYVYREARVAAHLPHSSDSQRSAPHMHKISRGQARPGDLIFYLSGGSAFHVSIYAGNGMQYSATVQGEKIRYQAIWSNAIEFRTDWH